MSRSVIRAAVILVLCMTANTARADKVDADQLGRLMTLSAQFCETVKDHAVRGSTSDAQAHSTAQAQTDGLFRRFLALGGQVDLSISRRDFEGLSQDAYAAALTGDQQCRIKIFEDLS